MTLPALSLSEEPWERDAAGPSKTARAAGDAVVGGVMLKVEEAGEVARRKSGLGRAPLVWQEERAGGGTAATAA